MKRGVVLPQHEAGPDELAMAARLARESGLDSVWVIDHLQGRPDPSRPFLEGWASLAWVAPLVPDMTVGILVNRAGLRPPRLVAVMASTLSKVCKQFICGVGIGDHTVTGEQAAYGIPFAKRAERIRLAKDTMDSLREHGGGAKVWVGGGTAEVIDLAAEADGWNYWGPPGEFKRKLADLGASEGIETSWAGSWPKEGEGAILGTGADHVIIATGAGNFRRRIEQVAALG